MLKTNSSESRHSKGADHWHSCKAWSPGIYIQSCPTTVFIGNGCGVWGWRPGVLLNTHGGGDPPPLYDGESLRP